MMNEKQFIASQKECAAMLGMSLSEYQKNCKDSKITKADKTEKVKYNNSILKFLGLTEKDLKIKKGC